MKTITHIVGNRPQFVKLAILYKALAQIKNLQQKIIHTSQHHTEQMSGNFFKELSIPTPTVQFPTLHSIGADDFIGKTAQTLQAYFLQNKNEVALAYGDTNTTLATALAATRTNTTLFHIEAGIRTGAMDMPEEINRILTDRLAQINFCCTQKNMETLKSEGFGSSIPCQLFFTGDLMYDAFMKTKSSAQKHTRNDYVLCTIHRAQNIQSETALTEIVTALNEIHQQLEVVVPLHPHTQKKIEAFGLEPKFTILPPQGYPAMKGFLETANYVITDSGGMAREAFFAEKKSVTVMPQPFWPEIMEVNAAIATKPTKEAIINAFTELPSLKADFGQKIFGEGTAAENISHLIESVILDKQLA